MDMDFDEIDYLEKTFENPGQVKGKETVNGEDGAVKSGEERKEKSNGRRRKDHDNDDSRHSSKHSRATDGDRDKHRSDRESKNRDVDGERSRDKEERNGRNRYRDRDESRKDHGYGHERDGERERDRSWRGRGQVERYRGNRDEKTKERTQEEFKERDMGKEFRDRNRDNRKRKEKKEDQAEPEADPERDQRTVFVYQLSLKASERDLYEFFSLAGKVRDVRIIMDRISRRSRGVGYIEFYDAMSVPMAIALSGQPLLGQPIMVKPSEAEKNLVQSTAAGGSGGQLDGGRRLYVGNLHYNITEEQLRLVFEAFGVVDLVQLPLDETGRCKGYAFVRFARLEDAKNALTMNGEVELAGRSIKVSTVTDQVGTIDAEANTGGDLDDYEGGGLPLSLQSRALLMQNLDRSGTVPSIPAPIPAFPGVPAANFQLPATNVPIIDPIGVPSECLLLKNMFDPKQEMEPDFYMDIREDVQDECSKFGSLKHIHIDRDGDGFVYLRFDNTKSASTAQHNLHGRWFAGKMITATFIVPQAYEHKFPDSIA